MHHFHYIVRYIGIHESFNILDFLHILRVYWIVTFLYIFEWSNLNLFLILLTLLYHIEMTSFFRHENIFLTKRHETDWLRVNLIVELHIFLALFSQSRFNGILAIYNSKMHVRLTVVQSVMQLHNMHDYYARS